MISYFLPCGAPIRVPRLSPELALTNFTFGVAASINLRISSSTSGGSRASQSSSVAEMEISYIVSKTRKTERN